MGEIHSHGFQELNHGGVELVLSAHYNSYGTRLAIGSSDHRIRVFDKSEDDEWSLSDQWRAHNGEVIEVKWNGATIGQICGSIGEDYLLKIWKENPSQAIQSGRRFQCIFAQSSPYQVGYASIDFKNIQNETYLGIITRDGILSLLEPIKPYVFDDWREIDQFPVCGQRIPRSEETSFKLSFQQAEHPNYNAINAGLDTKALSVAVGAMNTVKVYRVLKPEDGAYHFDSPVAQLTGTEGLVHDVAWAPEAWRAHDWIASAGSDGFVRIYEIAALSENQAEGTDPLVGTRERASSITNGVSNRSGLSGIGAGLAGVSLLTQGSREGADFGQLPHKWKLLAELKHEGVWKVTWVPNGNMLASAGDSGKVYMWRQGPGGIWSEFADAGPEFFDEANGNGTGLG